MDIEKWMPKAREIAASCWHDPKTEHLQMDLDLMESVARRIAAFMDSREFYVGLVLKTIRK